MNYFYYCYWFPSKMTTQNVYPLIKLHQHHIHSTGTQQELNKSLLDKPAHLHCPRNVRGVFPPTLVKRKNESDAPGPPLALHY